MFFKLHEEKRIGYKSLTDADLGRKKSSHQTHIGLFDDILTFLPNNADIEDAMVIYNDTVEFLTVNFDRIENPNHTFRSPKIRTGGVNTVSVVSFIKDKAKEKDNTINWYLFWFGLESKQPVFFLFDETSQAFSEISSLGIELFSGVKNRLESSNAAFSALLNYLENIVNKSGEKIAQELEIAAQTNETISRNYNNTYRSYDIEKARKIFSSIGREGEELVDKYFAQMLESNAIQHYEWKNKDKESGLPYDFSVQNLDGEVFYLDVKTTNYAFEQKMIFSSQEIKFVDNCDYKYYIYRVYNNNEQRFLRICHNAKALLSPINSKTSQFVSDIQDMAGVESMKMAILPSHKSLEFGSEIAL